MSGVHGQVLGHLARRGFEAAQAHFSGSSPDHITKLQNDAELYDNAGPEMEINPWEMLPVALTGLFTLLLIGLIKYNVGEVMASLTMIESPTSTAIIEDKPPAYTDEAEDAKAPIEPVADIEVTLISNKPITSSIRATNKHLKAIGGFRAQWRGAGLSAIYHFLHSLVANFFSGMLGMGLVGNLIVYVFTSVGLARIHMAWTHAMIAQPSAQPWWRRMVPRKQARAVLLPSLVFALAQQATFVLPVIVAIAVGLPDISKEHMVSDGKHEDCAMLVMTALRLLAVPATMIFVAFAILLPAAVTLTRIEALLLPEDQDTIVSFDRQAIIGDIDLSERHSSKKLFVQAWRSFDRAARWRLIKLYVKMVGIQFFVGFVGLHLMVAELYIIGAARLGLFFKSASAQVQLMAIDAQQN